MNRRKFLTLAAAVPLTAVGAYAVLRGPAGARDFTAPLFIPGASGPFGVLEPKGELTLTTELGSLPLATGQTTPFLWYRANYQGKDYQNPILKVKTGQRLDVTLANALDEGTIIHWHGLHLPGKMDGHPRDTIGPRAEYHYGFPVRTAVVPIGITPTRTNSPPSRPIPVSRAFSSSRTRTRSRCARRSTSSSA